MSKNKKDDHARLADGIERYAAEVARAVALAVRNADEVTLASATNAVAIGIRRRLLLQELESTGWNLAQTASRLCIPNDTALRREVLRCGLMGELDAARKIGAIKPGTKPGARRRGKFKIDTICPTMETQHDE